ncbi:MAG TPA: hypothetical protein VFO85_13075 [Vicinamibacteria bacterium]|nr:hypothetical protein [Vicinamibacteria bacterium]
MFTAPLIAVLLLTAAPAGPGPCPVETVRAQKPAEQAAFVTWLRANWKPAGWAEGESAFEDPARELGAFSLFVADVDNDGTAEHVLTSMGGSGGYLILWVFRRAGSAWRLEAENELSERAAFRHEYRDPLGDGSRLFLRVCGKTYVQFAEGIYPGLYPAPHVWEGGAVRPFCDAAWAKDQRRVFQALFDRKLLREAYGLLSGVVACAAQADPELGLWMQSDLALAAHRLGLHEDCLQHVANVRGSTRFAGTTSPLQRALDTNARLCEQARDAQARRGYDFAWLRELAQEPTKQAAVDVRFPALLHAIVPDAPRARTVREDLTLSVFAPEPTEFLSGRYVILSGCQPHNCENKGLIWVDLTARQAIFATAGLLGSRQVASTAIPPAFWKALRETAPGLWPEDGTKVKYLEPDGRETEVAAPEP